MKSQTPSAEWPSGPGKKHEGRTAARFPVVSIEDPFDQERVAPERRQEPKFTNEKEEEEGEEDKRRKEGRKEKKKDN